MTTTRTVRLGTRDVEFPSPQLQQLQDCNHLLGNREGLLRELQDKGYVFIRGLHDREEVLAARLAVLQYIQDSGQGKLTSPWQQGILDKHCGRGCVPFMEGRNDITHHPEVLKVLEGERPRAFFRCLLGEEPLTFDIKWLRGIHREAFTGAHVDWVYMGRGTEKVYTMWTPIGDVTTDMGTLAMCEGSHRLQGFQKLQDTYGNMDVDAVNLSGSGWFTEDPGEISLFGGEWKTSDFQAGDVLIFTMRTVHMSSANLTDFVRISCDTRWQPASHQPDPRYVGDVTMKPKFGLFAEAKPEMVTIEQLKQQWGF